MPDIQQVKLRHSAHYLRVLRDAGELYEQGGEALKRGLRLFDSDWSNIETGHNYAREYAEDREAAGLCRDYCIVATGLLDLRLHPQEHIQWLELALAAARRLRDHTAEAEHLNCIGLGYARMGDKLRAVEYYEQSLAIFRDLGTQLGEGKVLGNLGLAYAELGYPDRAVDLFNKALEMARGNGDRRNEGVDLCNLGQAYYLQREFRQAIELYEQSLLIARETGHLPGENTVLNNLGKAHAVLGRTRRAITFYDQALAIAREIGDRRGERNVLGNLGQAHHLLGDSQRAVEFYEQALDLARWIGDQLVEAELLNSMGDSYLDLGETERAVEYYQQRLTITKEIGSLRGVNVEHVFHDWSLNRPLPPNEIERNRSQQPDGSSSRLEPRHITWLHLSDIHFRASDSYDEDIVLTSLLGDIERSVKDNKLHLDFIGITGDLAFSGQKAEYEMARKFLDKLIDLTGLTNERLFVVPGNHDVDRSLITAGARAIGKALMDRNSTNAVLASPDDRRLLMARFRGYEEFFNDYFGSCRSFNSDRYYYVEILELSGAKVALLGLNSSWLAESDEDEARKLVIGERQTRAALRTAEEAGAEISVVLVHHPTEWIRGFDRSDSMALLLDQCDFVLHGHLHEPAATSISSPDTSALVIAAGACYETRHYSNSYSFVRLDLNARTGTIHFRSYSDKHGGFWAKDTHLYKNVPDGIFEFDLPRARK